MTQSLVRFLSLVLITLAVAATASTNVRAQAVGHTSGSFSVGGGGSANYSIPILIPPGINGMQPGVSLNYSSGGGNGTAGFGWGISGFSTITRCSKTIAQDNTVGGINFDSEDRFCLGGNRLRLVTGTYGGNGSEYRTEIESFVKVILHTTGGQGAAPSSGPMYFEVKRRDGTVAEYGNTNDSRIEAEGTGVVRLWNINKVTDTSANYLEYQYTEDTLTGSYRPIAGLKLTRNIVIVFGPKSVALLPHRLVARLSTHQRSANPF